MFSIKKECDKGVVFDSFDLVGLVLSKWVVEDCKWVENGGVILGV